jgi:hypothetical protein
MTNLAHVLQYAAAAGAVYCGLAYVYGFIWKPKGDRRLHVASLFFTGIALASLAAVIPSGMSPANAFAFLCATVFLIASVGCQSYCAFRGRRTDRRAPRTEGAGEPAPATPGGQGA